MSYLEKVIHPLEHLGAKVDVLLAISNCFATYPESKRALRTLTNWFSPRVSGASVFNSTGIGVSWLYAFELLDEVQRSKHVQYDYVFRTRPDLYLKKDLTTWGGDFSRLLFQFKGSICDELDSTQRFIKPPFPGGPPDRRGKEHPVEVALATRPECQIFVDDKMLWAPRRLVPGIIQRLRLDWQELGRDCMSPSPYTHNWARACLAKPHNNTPGARDGFRSCSLGMARTAHLTSDCAFMQSGAAWQFRPQRPGRFAEMGES